SSLDLSSFDTSNVTDMSEMFSNCRTLETIFVGDGWSTESVISSSDMFLECENLRGGAGTEYDPEHIDVEYARIDGGKDNPGYFTDIKTDAEEDTNDVMVIPEEVMDTIDYLYSNINDPTLKSVADTAIRLFNKFFSFKIV
uniref:BspA family leucine-rich repeat surface protein n=1 Tax=Ruminococcus sp. TaxID=41978 RepID=UPI0025F6A9D1